MKLRIQDNSIRFRISIKELETLAERGELTCETRLPWANETLGGTVFRYAVRRAQGSGESAVDLQPFVMTLLLGDEDFEQLQNPQNEGAYIRREWTDGDTTRRCLVFIEKDRPGSTCVKQEAWIYELNPGGAPVTVPRPVVKSGGKS